MIKHWIPIKHKQIKPIISIYRVRFLKVQAYHKNFPNKNVLQPYIKKIQKEQNIKNKCFNKHNRMKGRKKANRGWFRSKLCLFKKMCNRTVKLSKTNCAY